VKIYIAGKITGDPGYADAMRLQASTVRLQLALTDGDGNPMAAEIVQTDAKKFLKEAGYD